MRLTDTDVKQLPAPERGNKVTWDNTVKGLGIRITQPVPALSFWIAGGSSMVSSAAKPSAAIPTGPLWQPARKPSA
jgi:hypothetical protein